MDRTDELFLNMLKAALEGKSFCSEEKISSEEWERIFCLAEKQNVFPMIYHAVFKNEEIRENTLLKKRARQLVTLQAMRTDEFSKLYEELKKADAVPLVIKGIICRRLYPNPDFRLSADEDLLIPKEKLETCQNVMEEFGMRTEMKEELFEKAHEIPYRNKDGVLYIELHKNLFPPEEKAYGGWNRFFAKAFEDAAEQDGILTLSENDHLFYLICHAFKHFLHRGFGIRQICDIILFANAHGEKIDWEKIYENCLEIHAEVFAAEIFRIGERYLTFEPQKAKYPDFLKALETDETDMMDDILSGGVYGGESISRKHSANMTLEAVSADKNNKKGKNFLLSTVFPSANKLKGRYPFLERKPWLLPAAWVARIFGYLKEKSSTENDSAVDAIKTGERRIELLRKYKVIK